MQPLREKGVSWRPEFVAPQNLCQTGFSAPSSDALMQQVTQAEDFTLIPLSKLGSD
jgi:hypothetical protein